MTLAIGKKERRELHLGDDFGPVVVSVNGITLTIDADGKPTLEAPGDTTIITNGNIASYSADGCIVTYTSGRAQLKAPTDEQNNGITATVTEKAYYIGNVLPDGWVIGPRSPKTGVVMAIEPVSGALDGYQTWYDAEYHAKELREQGHANARQPSADEDNDELNAIYNEIVKAGRNGNAKLSTSEYSSRYWSSTTSPGGWVYARLQCLCGGGRVGYTKGYRHAGVRCVRDEPGIKLAS